MFTEKISRVLNGEPVETEARRIVGKLLSGEWALCQAYDEVDAQKPKYHPADLSETFKQLWSKEAQERRPIIENMLLF